MIGKVVIEKKQKKTTLKYVLRMSKHFGHNFFNLIDVEAQLS